jgi:hypothetical protein
MIADKERSRDRAVEFHYRAAGNGEASPMLGGHGVVFDVPTDPATHAATSVHRVILQRHTWRAYIVIAHPELTSNESKVEDTIRGPTGIFTSTSVTGNFVFVRSGITDGNGRSLCVVVKPMPGQSAGIIPVAYFAAANNGSQVWP